MDLREWTGVGQKQGGQIITGIALLDKGYNSRTIIECCRPFEWKEEFPEVVETSQELMEKVTSKWREQS